MTLGSTQNINYQAPLNSRDSGINLLGGKKPLGLANLEIRRHSKSHESRRLNDTNIFKAGFLPSLVRDHKMI
jgi:hypothetical protein